VKIRIMGTADEVAGLLDLLMQLSDMADTGLEILDTSDLMPNRAPSRLVRQYIEARINPSPTSGGVPVTGAVVDRLAVEAAAGYDPARFTPRRRGRP
jgi:hypothetical protein